MSEASSRVEKGDDGQASAYSRDSGTFQKAINIRPGKIDAIVVEMPQWDRIQRRVKALEELWAIEWLAAGASAAASTAIGCLIAAASLPHGKETGIGPAVQPVLLVGALAALIITVICLGLHFRVKKDRKKEGTDIIDEMETYEKSFELKRAGEVKNTVEGATTPASEGAGAA